MALSDAQKDICSSDARFRVAVTGRRFGKTHVAMRELARFASSHNNQLVWYVAPSYRMAKGIVWDQLKGSFLVQEMKLVVILFSLNFGFMLD